jgi:phage host-nuclease inhibitor protein Gam
VFRPPQGFKARLLQLVERATLEARHFQAPQHWFIDQWQEFEFPSKHDMSFDLQQVLRMQARVAPSSRRPAVGRNTADARRPARADAQPLSQRRPFGVNWVTRAICSVSHREDMKPVLQLEDDFWKATAKADTIKLFRRTYREGLRAALKGVAYVLAKQAVGELVKQWASLNKLQTRYEQYLEKHAREKAVDQKNKAQHQLRESFDPFFAALHEGVKQLDKTVRQHEQAQAEKAQADGKRGTTDRKTKALKTALEALHKEVKNAESFYQHIHWLQERFPKAEYEDVTGLCKLTGLAEVKEHDYSLNPGRYVGVVIEEDGKTEEEFFEEILSVNDEIESLNKLVRQLDRTVGANIKLLAGEP